MKKSVIEYDEMAINKIVKGENISSIKQKAQQEITEVFGGKENQETGTLSNEQIKTIINRANDVGEKLSPYLSTKSKKEVNKTIYACTYRFAKIEAQGRHLFHDSEHTFDYLLNNALDIINKQELKTEKERKEIFLAVLFHDIGYIHGKQDHEETSIKIMKKFLESINYSGKTKNIENMIRATNPTFIKDEDYDGEVDKKRSRQEKCIKDADLGHLAKPFDEYMIQFFKFHYELRKEGGTKRKLGTKKELLDFQKKFFQKHSYLSKNIEERKENKQKNITLFEEKIEKIYNVLEKEKTRQGAKKERDNLKETNFQEK